MINRYRSVVAETDFVKYADPSIANNKVTEDTTIALNKWAWNDTMKAVHMNMSDSVGGAFIVPLGFLKAGDVIRAKFEAYNITGYKSEIVLINASNVVITRIQSTTYGSFEDVQLDWIISTDGNYKIRFGGYYGTEHCYLRNCIVEMETIYDELSPSQVIYKKSIKQFFIQATSTGVFNVDNRFGFDTASYTLDTSKMMLTLGVPFTYTGKRPVCMITEDNYLNSKDYVVLAQSVTHTSFDLVFYLRSTMAVVNPNTIPLGTGVNIVLFGFDNA